VGSVGGPGAEVREVLSVLFAAVPGHQVQHHHQTKNAILHRQPHSAVRRHLLGDHSAVLHASQLRREDHDGHDDPNVSQHLPAARSRDQPIHVARHAAHRQVSPLHDGPRRLRHNRDRFGAESSYARCKLTRDVAVGGRTVPQSSSSAALHATTATAPSTRKQTHEGTLSLCSRFVPYQYNIIY